MAATTDPPFKFPWGTYITHLWKTTLSKFSTCNGSSPSCSPSCRLTADSGNDSKSQESVCVGGCVCAFAAVAFRVRTRTCLTPPKWGHFYNVRTKICVPSVAYCNYTLSIGGIEEYEPYPHFLLQVLVIHICPHFECVDAKSCPCFDILVHSFSHTIYTCVLASIAGTCRSVPRGVCVNVGVIW